MTPTPLPSAHKTIAVALTGASGMPYGLRLVECLLSAGCRVWLLYSQVAQIVARQEMDVALPARPDEVETQLGARFRAEPGQFRVFGREEWFAPPASGSNPPDAMVVCPCTMGTLASIAAGLAGNLIERAVIFCNGPSLDAAHFPADLSATVASSSLRGAGQFPAGAAGDDPLMVNLAFKVGERSLSDLEDAIIHAVLERSEGNKTLAAKRLGITRWMLDRRRKA